MKERGLIFGAPMVRALLAGKTQTRRIVKPRPMLYAHDNPVRPENRGGSAWVFMSHADRPGYAYATNDRRCPYGVPGDRLWVRETWQAYDNHTVRFKADYDWPGPWKSPLFLPRAASRILLEITDVRVERIQDASAKDIIAEGAVERSRDDPHFGKCPISAFDGKVYLDLRSLWAAGWDSINKKKAPWASNPFVWCISFRRIP